VTQVVPNLEKDSLVPWLLKLPEQLFDLEPVARLPVPGARLRTRAFIKVQDGCNNRCSFCVTRIARGAGRSRSIHAVLADIDAALDGGCQEIVLTGVHLGSWGRDLSPRQHVRSLVAAVLASSRAPRLRLSSLEPWDLDEDFFQLWQEPHLCRHLHLPLQSGSAATLRRMRRRTAPRRFAALLEAARRTIPDVAITTDIIVGFPGESQAEFSESLDFVRRMHFAGGHVFAFSPRPGTPAADMPEQVAAQERKERSLRMRQVLAESEQKYQGAFLGRELDVLWESAAALGPDGWQMSGLTGNYLRVSAHAPRQCWNHITPVRLTGVLPSGLQGQLVSSACE
jgi:threonylcarbamoyladenosine tRNA methylthiotransferase MtaB